MKNLIQVNIRVALLLLLFFFSTNTYSQNSHSWAIALHGGAGSKSKKITKEREAQYKAELIKAREIGETILSKGGSAIDAVEAVVLYLENCPLFNAGKGAVKNSEGLHELDAAIMDGRSLNAGAIAGVRNIKNPIKCARAVMDKSPHVLLIGDGASSFAANMGLELVENEYFSTQDREVEFKAIRSNKESGSPMGTVGCVAKDIDGNLAAATSTGGMAGKSWGRVGDVPIIGAGTYANNKTVAVSGTGHGELWIRRVVAYDISALMEYRGLSVGDAAKDVIFNKIDKMKGSGGGVIAVDKTGNIAMEFNTSLMHRAWSNSDGERGVEIYK